MFSDEHDEEVQHAILRRRYVYETISQEGTQLLVAPTLVNSPKTCDQLAELHKTYNLSRYRVQTLERAVELVEELASLDRGKLSGELGHATLDGTRSHTSRAFFSLNRVVFFAFQTYSRERLPRTTMLSRTPIALVVPSFAISCILSCAPPGFTSFVSQRPTRSFGRKATLRASISCARLTRKDLLRTSSSSKSDTYAQCTNALCTGFASMMGCWTA